MAENAAQRVFFINLSNDIDGKIQDLDLAGGLQSILQVIEDAAGTGSAPMELNGPSVTWRTRWSQR